MSDVIQLSSWDGKPVTQVTMNRPEKYNAVTEEFMVRMKSAFDKIEADDSVRVVVLTGAPPAFCSGADVDDLFVEQTTVEAHQKMQEYHEQTVRSIIRLEKPIIAMVNGPAVGGGMSFALCCDLIVASREAYFQSIFPRIGLIPDLGLMYHLVRAVGYYQAKDLLLTGRRIDSEEARQLGFVNRLVDHEKLEETTESLVDELLECSPLAQSHIKDLMEEAFNSSMDPFLQREALEQGIMMTTDDIQEARQAFQEDRKPNFQGR